MSWTIVMLFFSTLLTTFAIGTLIWLRRPTMVRDESPGRETNESPGPAEGSRTSYLPYPALGFAAPPPVTDPTEYVPIERLPVMAAFRRREAAREAARAAAVMAKPPPEQIGLGVEELGPLFDSAVATFVDWRADMTSSISPLAAIVGGSERRLAERMTMLMGASEVGSRAVFESAMLDREAEVDRRIVAGLALLARDPTATLRRIDGLVESADVAGSIEALRCWASHDADMLLVEQAKQAGPECRHFWLDRLLERMLSPGDEWLGELLATDDPGQLQRGLGLVCLADEPARFRSTAQQHYFAANPAVRVAAVAAGVFLRDRTAWLHCRQMATDTATPRATELIAMLGETTEQDSLLDWAERATLNDMQVWALALTGRRRAAELASRHLARARGERRHAEALRHVIGGPIDEAALLLAHWDERKPALSAEPRYLLGQIHDAEAQRACMSQPARVHRRALAEELLFRSDGRCRLRCHGLAADLERQLAALDTHR